MAGKLKYCALGDSITYGFIPRNYPGYPGQLKSYAALAAEMLGAEFCNHGISDSCIANLPGHDPMCIRYKQMPDDADIITVMGGTNDVRCGVPLGHMDDRCDTTFYGALHTLCQGLYDKYIAADAADNTAAADADDTAADAADNTAADAADNTAADAADNTAADAGIGKKRIILLTPPKLLDAEKSSLPNTPENNAGALYQWDPWIAAIKEVAAYYSFQIIDMYNHCGIEPHRNRTVKGYEDGYFGNYNPFITDGTHPTQEGAQMMANLLVKEING